MKIFLTLAAVVATSFSTISEQPTMVQQDAIEEQASPCDTQSTLLNTSCGSWCVSVQIPLTGNLSVDVGIYNATNGTGRRKPTVSELMAVADELC